YYIGKRGDEGLEIVDWRAPLARRYYQKSRTSFSINDYDYKLILRRAIRTQNGKVLDIKNEYLSLKDYLTAEEIGGRDEAVIFDPFLKDIIESRKEKREITDIIETIQEKQYEIITLPERDEFTVQGVAGSGKTMILLHRLSYVLYNNENLRPSDVLVITPSDSFNAFIDELSTILELEKVKTSTLDKYFLNLLKNAGVDISARLDYTQPVPQELLNYIYSEKFPVDVKRKLEKIYDGVYGMFADEGCGEVISVIVQACARQSAEYDKIKNASQRVRRCVLGEIKEKADGGLYYTKQFRYMFNCVLDIKEFFTLLDGGRDKGYAYFYRQLLSFYKSLKYLRRYSEKICTAAVSDLQELFNLIDREISDLKRYKIKTGNVEMLTYADRIEKREQLKAEISAAVERVKRIAEDFYPLYDFAEVVRGERDFVAIGKCETTYDIARFFYRETVKKSKVKFGMSTKKLCRFDPFALSFILSELNFPLSPKYAFLFVDEAQDISPAEYEILKKVNDRAAFNIFGDLKQNVTPYRGISDWSQLGYKVFNLNLNYRNTNQIVDFVSHGLGIDMRPIGFDGEGVERIEPRSVTKYFADKNGLCAVITSECDLEEYSRKSYNVLRQTGRISKSKINIMTVYESKGLEFTAVAVADKNMTDNEKYIAYTRALKNLAIITK
ncbi:MAG: UvrD-helicase domain-containing protein, partial [Clostridia bacterium]|nr:UvrD-helicase domain-containing protein [Clostridia bacterium]